MNLTVLLATANEKKLVELRRLVDAAETDWRIVGLSDVPSYPEPVEDADTFEGNALIKANACTTATGLPALADDSGLAVDELNGMPGVRSARWAGCSQRGWSCDPFGRTAPPARHLPGGSVVAGLARRTRAGRCARRGGTTVDLLTRKRAEELDAALSGAVPAQREALAADLAVVARRKRRGEPA